MVFYNSARRPAAGAGTHWRIGLGEQRRCPGTTLTSGLPAWLLAVKVSPAKVAAASGTCLASKGSRGQGRSSRRGRLFSWQLVRQMGKRTQRGSGKRRMQ